jgi:hypothetical protein
MWDLTRIRGWLLVFCIMLVPHIVLAPLILIQSWPIVSAPSADPSIVSLERTRMLTQAVILIGNSVGLALILTRSRYAPAYFTVYLLLSPLLILADPDTIATQVEHARRLGLSHGADDSTGRAQAVMRTTFALLATGAWLGYWLESKRVRAVFGSAGLEAVRGRM